MTQEKTKRRTLSMPATAYPYFMGDLESSCGWYSCINALRVCLSGTPQRDSFYHDLIRYLVREVNPSLQTYVITGLDISDVAKVLAAIATFVNRRLGLRLRFSRPFLGRCDLSQVEYLQEIDRLIRLRRHSCIVAVGTNYHRYHWTVPVRITPRTIRVADSCNDKVIRRRGLRVAKSGTRCGLSFWMPKATFVLALEPALGEKTNDAHEICTLSGCSAHADRRCSGGCAPRGF